MKFCRGNISLNPGDVQLRDICYLPKYMKNCCYFSSNYFLEINNFLYQNFKLYVYFLHFCCELFRWNKKLLSMRLWILEWDTLFLIFPANCISDPHYWNVNIGSTKFWILGTHVDPDLWVTWLRILDFETRTRQGGNELRNRWVPHY